MKHKLKRIHRVDGITSSITPTCSCGWSGWPEYSYSNWQFANIEQQEEDHLRCHTNLIMIREQANEQNVLVNRES